MSRVPAMSMTTVACPTYVRRTPGAYRPDGGQPNGSLLLRRGPERRATLLPANRELVRGLGVVSAFVLVAYLVILARHALLEIFLAVALAAILEPAGPTARAEAASAARVRGRARRGRRRGRLDGGRRPPDRPVLQQVRDLMEALPSVAHQLRESGSLGDLDHGNEVSQALEDAAKWFTGHLPQIAESLLGLVGGAVGTGFTAFTILFMAFFLLLEGARLERWSRGYIDPGVQARVERVGGDITRLTGNYVAGALAIALIASVVMYVAMRIGTCRMPPGSACSSSCST